jgi:hypothetical protein
MTRRRLTTAATLLVLVVVRCVMAVWGLRAATAPIPGETSGSSSKDPTCGPEDQTVAKYLRRGEVTVSVYNAGAISGRAQKTMDLLEGAGFKVGEVKNAPEGVKVPRAAVYSTKADDPADMLVAQALGKKTQVVHSDAELGPGVHVIIGDKFKKLDPRAPKRIELAQPEVSCQ